METSQDNENCGLCDEVFLTKCDLEHHFVTIHKDEPSFTISCNVCSKTFSAPNKLNTHMKIAHEQLKKFKSETM